MSPLASALYVGTVRHRRRRPTTHAFRYRTYHVLVDLDELGELDRRVRGFGHNRRALASFLDTDHLGTRDEPVRAKLATWLATQGVTLPAGPVRVLTNLRVLGHVFNPVSWWFCHDVDGELALVVAEVSNTFGESHGYVLDELRPGAGDTWVARTDKVFHVSPFLPIDGLTYRFTFARPGARALAHVEVHDADGIVFDATQAGRRVPLTSASLARVLLRHPAVTLQTVARIHRQALTLWRKRVPFHRKPAPPPGFDAGPSPSSSTDPADLRPERPMVPRPTPRERRALATISGMLAELEVGALEVRLPDGRRRVFGAPDAELRTDLDVVDWRFFTRLLHGASVGVGESYVAGEWRSSDLVSLFRLVVANRRALRRITPAALLNVAGDKLIHAARANRLGRSKRNVAAHYDLSNELYATFLDETMTYSSAVFESPTVTLEQAQLAKYRRLAEKARIDASCHVLEIGCGWGGFAVFAATTYGCRVTGITLSEEQAALARRRVADAGVEHLVDIRIVDYRQVEGRFDRIVSIEMLEAVGHRYLGTYFATIDRLLAPDGLAAVQVITIPEQRYASYRRRPDFIQRYIFPGGHLPSLEAMARSMGRHSDLYVDEVENIGMHYAETLRRWRERFLDRVDDVRALGFDDRFVRMWEFYLAYCEAAFLARYIGDLQLVLTRPMNGTLGTEPYGRQLVPVREADLPWRRDPGREVVA